MLLATWNVNSIRARLERVVQWLESHRPDVLCLQETKVEDAQFPIDAFTALGYRSAIHGQKSYNGVAILSREPIDDITCGFEDGDEEHGARLIIGTVRGIRIHSVYVPNGQIVGTEAWETKLRWLARSIFARLDVCDPAIAPGVGTPVKGGLDYREAHMLMEIIADSGLLRGLDLVEVNPILDDRNMTAILGAELASSALGQKII